MKRLEFLRRLLAETGFEALLVSKPENRYYLSGFTGSSGWLLISPKVSLLFTDFRYVEQAAQQAPEFEMVRCSPGGLAGTLGEELRKLGLGSFGFEREHLTYGEFENLSRLAAVRPLPAPPLVERLRAVKQPEELVAVRRAIKAAEEAWNEVRPMIKPGRSERELALELEWRMRRKGAQAVSFEIIAASGPRGALPHGIASDRRLACGEMITVDFGCRIDGYCSDMTRTVSLGRAPEILRAVYGLVRRAQEEACQAVRPGITGHELDAVARRIIAEAGWGDNFGHGLGHGVGLEVHEAPRLAPISEEPLQAGMVVTIEPGVYLPGIGGVRIEDMVLVTESGGEVLTSLPKELLKL